MACRSSAVEALYSTPLGRSVLCLSCSPYVRNFRDLKSRPSAFGPSGSGTRIPVWVLLGFHGSPSVQGRQRSVRITSSRGAVNEQGRKRHGCQSQRVAHAESDQRMSGGGPSYAAKGSAAIGEGARFGLKASGLASLPPSWTPDFVALEVGTEEHLADRDRLQKAVAAAMTKLGVAKDGLMVRSSSVEEGLGKR